MSYCWWLYRRRDQLPLSTVGFHPIGSHHSGLSHAPSIWVDESMEAYGVLAPRSAIKNSRLVQAGAGYCGSRSVCWVYGIIGYVQAQLE
jgi:hypothetical protein